MTKNNKAADYDVPIRCKHKPIFATKDYALIDGYYKNDTDVLGLSLGKAQWSGDEFIPSVKVWRQKNGKITRNSEEITLTRALDLATLTVQALDSVENGCEPKKYTTMHGSVVIEKVTTPNFVNLKHQLIGHLNDDNKKNLVDIETHIDYLNKVIQDYYKHKEDKEVSGNSKR